jgi:polysaccharide export outer membrane protein
MRLPRILTASAVIALLMTIPEQVSATELVPQTRFRLTVVQWMPTKGSYEEWTALGGEFTVSAGGDVALPVIGAVSVGTMDGPALADDIASRLQKKTGLVNRPDVSVEIVEYPPIYVVGEVAKPGEYKFRDGLTALQALALSGGERLGPEGQTEEEIRLVAQLRAEEDVILRRMARIARLEAEITGAGEIRFPASEFSDSGRATEILEQEKVIFAARAGEIERQAASLSELRVLLDAEISALEKKNSAIDEGIASAERELAGVTKLIEQGFAVTSRQSDMERIIAGYRTDRLDQVTAIMRARQGIAEATRNLDGVRDRHRTQIADELQAEQAELAQNRLKRDVAQSLLLNLLAVKPGAKKDDNRKVASFTITRVVKGRSVTLAAADYEPLQPGDVLSVDYSTPADIRKKSKPMKSGLASAEPEPLQ